jgi:threonine dehydratase
VNGRQSKRTGARRRNPAEAGENGRLIPLPVTRPSAWNQLNLSAAEAAQRRLATYIKRTPVAEAWLPAASGRTVRIYLKLENLQVAGGAHARGVLNAVLRLPRAQVARGLVTTDGTGHHGATVAYAGWLLGVPATIYVPRGAATPDHLQRLRGWNAAIVVGGRTWDETYRTALLRAQRDRLAYIHLFDDPSLIAGYSTLGLELLDALPDLGVLVMTAAAGGAL